MKRYRLNMKRIMIFGASSGIGKMLAQKYAAEGNMVAVAARREEQLLQLQKEYPSNIIVCRADVASPAVEEGGEESVSVKGKFGEMLSALGGVDLVIYSSGMGKQNAAFDMNIEYSTINVNVKGFTALAAAVVEYGCSAGHHVQIRTWSGVNWGQGGEVAAWMELPRSYGGIGYGGR